MTKDHTPKKRKGLIAAAAAVGVAGTLVLGHATDTTAENLVMQLANTVIGAGGSGDSTSVRVPAKLDGTIVPATYGYDPVNYPATINLAASRDAGIPVMLTALDTHAGEPHLIVAGYSEGTLIAEQVRRDLQAKPPGFAPSDTQLTFEMIASPFAGNGGILARFPWLDVPFIIDPMGAGQPTRYDTTYYANEYDVYADFPAYFNPLALLNSLLAIRYAHPDEYYDPIDPATAPKVEKVVPNSAGGTDTYILYLNPHLPLFGPIRELSAALSLTPITEPVLSAIEPLFRLAIDMAYTDRTYANPATPTPFSLITPPAKIIEAIAGVPGALVEGATNLLSGGQSSMTLQRQSVSVPVAPEQQAPDGGTQRLALASVAEPESESADPVANVDAGPAPKTEFDKQDPDNKDTDGKDSDTKILDNKDTGEKHLDKKGTDQITHPTMRFDGNKVKPTTTAGATTPGNQSVVALVPTTATNSTEEKADPAAATSTPSPPTPASTTVDANDVTDHHATDDAAAA